MIRRTTATQCNPCTWHGLKIGVVGDKLGREYVEGSCTLNQSLTASHVLSLRSTVTKNADKYDKLHWEHKIAKKVSRIESLVMLP